MDGWSRNYAQDLRDYLNKLRNEETINFTQIEIALALLARYLEGLAVRMRGLENEIQILKDTLKSREE